MIYRQYRGIGGGGISLNALATAANAGQIRPIYILGNTFNAGYSHTPQTIPADYYVDDVTAQQIAGLLGATVVKLPLPELNYDGTGIPPANYIQFGGGNVVNAAYIANACTGSISAGSSQLCGREQMLSYIIPGSVLDDSCVYDSQAASTVVVSTPYIPPTVISTTPVSGETQTSQGSSGTNTGTTNTTNTTTASGTIDDLVTQVTDSTGMDTNTMLLIGVAAVAVVLILKR